MQNFCIAYRGILNKHSLYATGTTGRLIEEDATTPTVNKFLEGSLGGAQQFASQIENNSMDLVFYFRDPNEVSPYQYKESSRQCFIFCEYSQHSAGNEFGNGRSFRFVHLTPVILEWREAYRS